MFRLGSVQAQYLRCFRQLRRAFASSLTIFGLSLVRPIQSDVKPHQHKAPADLSGNEQLRQYHALSEGHLQESIALKNERSSH